ncbi:hypothetical protein CY35_05G031400 [Sphagnum magellanicum]|nr:hypothetical protein CY35_05G031400 [Sphagnum magellanicum]
MACELDLVLTCTRGRKQLNLISSSLMISTCFLIISASLLVASGADAATDQKLFFVFGDSYADTGNLPKSGPHVDSSWLYPYGITWPHYPDGRFCDGKIQTDFYAELLGIPTPPPYLYLTGQSIAHGVNFATGGSGVTYALGTNPLGTQVDNLELFLCTDPYSKVALANSISLVAVDGNDYTTFNGNISNTEEDLVYINRIVAGISFNLQRLYNIGLRDVMVSNLLRPGCTPFYSQKYNYTTCDTSVDSIARIHNELLLNAVEKINARNPGARFIILDQYAAFDQIYTQAKAAGFSDGLVPCCKGSGNYSCADTDPATGKPLYTVCKRREKAVFWDLQHPTMAAWEYIVNLYAKPGFLLLADAPTLLQWWQNDAAIQEPVASPIPQPAGEFQQAVDAILPHSVNYSESLGLVESVDVAALLGQYPAGAVTVFLPNNGAYNNTYVPVIDAIFSYDLVNEVALYHIVGSFLDYNTLLSSHPSSLTTASVLQLPVTIQGNEIFVGQGDATAQIYPSAAQIVQPNLYVVPGEIAVHGIDNVLFPPGLVF